MAEGKKENRRGEDGKDGKVGFDLKVFQEHCDKRDDDDFLEDIYGVTDAEYSSSVDSFLKKENGKNREK